VQANQQVWKWKQISNPSSVMGVETTPAVPVDVDVMVVAHLKM
jgi:hypothetical protein